MQANKKKWIKTRKRLKILQRIEGPGNILSAVFALDEVASISRFSTNTFPLSMEGLMLVDSFEINQ